MDKFLTVSELAAIGNVTNRTIRLYMDKGLLTPVQIGHNFFFIEDNQVTLENILRAKRLGFTLEEIKSCQTDNNIDAITNQLTRLENLISDAKIEMKLLQKSLNKGGCS